MFSWKFSWLTVLIFSWTPVFFDASSSSLAATAFGAASDEFDPNVTVPPADEPPPPPPLDELVLLPPPQAASKAAAAPAPRPPRSTERRLSAATDGGTSRARYSASVWGRDMVPPREHARREVEQNLTRPPRCWSPSVRRLR